MKKLILLLFIPFLFACSDDSADRNYSSSDSYLGKYIGGGGGGQPFYATAGGKETKGLTLALEEAEKILFSDN